MHVPYTTHPPPPTAMTYEQFLELLHAPGATYGVTYMEDYKARLMRRYGWEKRPA